MIIEIENLGPINHVKMSLSRFNIIIGRNNIGKSHLAKAIFALIATISPASEISKATGRISDLSMLELGDELYSNHLMDDKGFEKLRSLFNKDGANTSDFLVELIRDVISLHRQHFNVLFNETLLRTFSISLDQLVRLGSDYSKISLILSPLITFKFQIDKQGKTKSEIDVKVEKLVATLLKNMEVVSSLQKICGKGQVIKTRQYAYLNKIVSIIRKNIFQSFKFKCPYYLPAGRSGLLDSWNTIQSAWSNLASLSFTRGLKMPPLPGTAALYFENLRSLSTLRSSRKGKYRHYYRNFADILGGEVRVDDTSEMGDLIYTFKHSNMERTVAITNAGSMVKEIGPLSLFATEILDKNDLFIVEEPESHLHPKAQTDLAKLSLSMASEGLCFLYTTHSDVFLRKAAFSFYEMWREKSERRLTTDDFSVTLLKSMVDGSCSERVKMRKYGSIDELPTFDEVFNELYGQEIRFSYHNQ